MDHKIRTNSNICLERKKNGKLMRVFLLNIYYIKL